MQMQLQTFTQFKTIWFVKISEMTDTDIEHVKIKVKIKTRKGDRLFREYLLNRQNIDCTSSKNSC